MIWQRTRRACSIARMKLLPMEQRFNRTCSIIALVVMLLLVWSAAILRPGYFDFEQYYMGGLIARSGSWESLYPFPKPGSVHNPGEPSDSTVDERFLALSKDYGLGSFFRYIQPPPPAVAYVPLTYLPAPSAHLVWLGLMGFFAWLLALQGVRVMRFFVPESRWHGLFVLLVCLSPTMLRAVRNSNVTPLVAWSLGYALIGLITGEQGRSGMAAGLAMLLKYAAVPLVPVMILLGRWQMIILMMLCLFLVVALTWPVTEFEPYAIYATRILPTLARSHEQTGNQSLNGFLLRAMGQQELPGGMQFAYRIAELGVLVIIVAIAARRLRKMPSPDSILSAATALIAWMLVFGPIVWPHYPLYFVPVLGWLLLASREDTGARILSLIAIALLWAPLGGLPWVSLPNVVISHMLWGHLLILVSCIIRLMRPVNVASVNPTLASRG